MGWNGLDLQTDFSELLSDTSSDYKVKVSKWIRDIEIDIMTKYDWPFARFKEKKNVVAGSEEQSLVTSPPSTAPTLALSAGGNLIVGSVYKVKVTFYELISGIETQAIESDSITVTDGNQTIGLAAIPTSSEPLCTGRKIYLDADGGGFFYLATIADQTTTTYSITDESTSKIEPPDHPYFKLLEGDVFVETSGPILSGAWNTIRSAYPTDISTTSGTPIRYSAIRQDTILCYPAPSSGKVLSFYYYKYPRGIYPDINSIPTIPIYLKEVLEAGIEYKGYKYRDRSGKIELLNVYNALLDTVASRMCKNQKGASRIRDVVGDSSGFSIN